MRSLIAAAAEAGEMRADVPADELAHFALTGIAAARQIANRALDRLIGLVSEG